VFCNHETSVSVKIDKKAGVGNLSCKSCGQAFQTSINCMFCALTLLAFTDAASDLTQPVDVYSDWIDACDAVAKDTAATATPAMPPAARQRLGNTSSRDAAGDKYTTEDGFIEDDEEDAEAEFADD
jgi:transcription elongation factor Elf1